MHFAQVGYLFTISAGIILLLSGWFYEMLKLLKFKILQILFLIIFIFVESLTFINGWQTFRPKNNRKQQIIFDKIIDYSISPHQLDWPGIRKNDEKIQKIIRFIKEFKPEETLIITEFGSRYLNNYENWPDNFRILSYYLPEYEIYEIFLGDDKIYFKTQQRIYSKKETADIIILPATVKNLIFVNPMTKINGPQDVLIASHQNFSGGIHILKVDNVKRLEYLGYNFIFKEDKSIFNRKIFLKWDYLKEGFEKI